MFSKINPGDLHHETYYFKFFSSDIERFGGRVFLQAHKRDKLERSDVVAFKTDYEYSRNINTPGILKGKELVTSPEGIFLVKEYFDSFPLSAVIHESPLTVDECISMAIQLVHVIDDIHQKGFVIKNLSSYNILTSRDRNTIKLSNVCQASNIEKGKDGLVIQNGWEEAIVYLSPEQTGRVGRSTDYRSDYYALGVVLYEMLTGVVPFKFTSIMELVHGHIALPPAPPSLVRSDVPEVLSRLVLKLLAKNAEDRYQGASGLLHDLHSIEQNKDNLQALSEMPLGKKDAAHIFNISEWLYGRQKELGILKNAFDRITKGPIEITYVFGYSGIGKTRLIEELHNQISREKGFFASGKFDQYHKDTPYFAFTQAFNNLVLQLFSEEKDKVMAWRRALAKALDGRGQVIVNIAKDLELLLGEQDKVLDLGFKDNQERFKETVIDFLSVLDSEKRPIVFFIDDLQWADTASLDLITALLESRLQNILIIGAYRDNEVDVTHPLHLQMQYFKEKRSDQITECALSSLPNEDINQLIADSLQLPPKDTKELSEVITNKTQGNPFFVKQFFQSLVDLELIFFNAKSAQWEWDYDRILDLDVTDNVVDLLVKKIQTLTPDTQKVISMAACIGNIWDFDTLKIITGLSEGGLSNSISEIIKNGFATPLGAWKEFYADLSEYLDLFAKEEEVHEFKFLHDKIQQAAYSLIKEEDRVETHIRIGRLLLDQLGKEDIENNIFDILDHLNFSVQSDLKEREKEELGELNLSAGIKAKKSNAIETSVLYLETAMILLEHKRSSESYKQALIERCEGEYLRGNYDKAEALFDTAIDEAESDFNKADILSRKMIVYENTQRHHDALDVGIQALALLGTEFPKEDIPEVVQEEFPEVLQKLKGFSIDDLLNLTPMSDPKMLLSMKTLMNFWGPLYLLARQNQLAWMVLRMVRLSTIHGNSIESAVAYAFYGYLISASMHEYDQGYEFGQLGIRLNSKIDDKTLRSKVIVIAEGCISHWKKPYHVILPEVTRAYEIGVETNDIIYAGYAVTFMLRCHLRGNRNLLDSYNVLVDLMQFGIKIKHELTHQFALAWLRYIVRMADLMPDETVFGEWVKEEDHIDHMTFLSETKGVHYYLATHHISESNYDYHHGNFESGLEHTEAVMPMLHSVTGLYEFAEHPIYRLLNLLGCAKRNPEILKEQLEMYESTLDIIEKRATACPDNFASKYQLILAEHAMVDRDMERACERLEDTIREAVKYGDQDTLGVAYERLAEISFSDLEVEKAFTYIKRSIEAYQTWGALHKVKALREKYTKGKDLLESDNINDLSLILRESKGQDNIDLETIVTASAAISKEVRLEKLMETLLRLLVQNAGAQNAYLFLERDGNLMLEACSQMSNDNKIEMASVPLPHVDGVFKGLVNLTFNSGETISIDDAENENKYASLIDKDYPARSVLSIPIKSGNRIVAIIYLDNKLSHHAFPKDRVALLEVLSGQMAISIGNALLYENLEKKVSERTADLEKEKQKSEDLLLNILPSDVFQTLRTEGQYTPRRHDSVSILFADFANFTQLSQHISAEELVAMLDECYKAFDAICEDHGIEKIKTIGDAYMCVAGLRGVQGDHAARACRTGLDMLAFLQGYNKERAQNGQRFCDIRVGIHTGPVIDGIVGSRKFAFDIWGDSVNTAARMQSHGVPGKLNISDTTWSRVKDHDAFTFESRGKIPVKHKGEIGMYFVTERK